MKWVTPLVLMVSAGFFAWLLSHVRKTLETRAERELERLTDHAAELRDELARGFTGEEFVVRIYRVEEDVLHLDKKVRDLEASILEDRRVSEGENGSNH